MKRLAVDLHIHSALSPCGDEEMTPNNIVNMAALKGLDAIALTDHNSVGNLPATVKAAERAGVLLVPGIEVQTREEVHLLCYFPTLEAALAFGEMVYAALLPLQNRPGLFGPQLLFDENDAVVGEEPRLLIQSADLSLEQAVEAAIGLGGAAVPAHISRPANSLIGNLGFIPENAGFKTLELFRGQPPGVDTGKYALIRSSDAHRLDQILEREFFLTVEEAGVPAIVRALGSGEGTT